MSAALLADMESYNNSKDKLTEHRISDLICLISALSIHPPIRQRLILNPDNL